MYNGLNKAFGVPCLNKLHIQQILPVSFDPDYAPRR